MEDKELDVVLSDQVKGQMTDDPKMAEFLRNFSACARQAMAGVQSGQYDNFADAMESITGNRPTQIDLDDDFYDSSALED